MSKTALLMIQDPKVMGVEIQNATPDEAVEGFLLYLQKNVFAPLVEKVGEDEDVADAYEAIEPANDLESLSRLTNDFLSAVASAGVSVPLVVMTVQEDLVEDHAASVEAYESAMAVLRPEDPEPERYEYHGGCTFWYTVVSTDEIGRRHAAEFRKFDDATQYMKRADAYSRLSAVMIPDRYDSGKAPAAEWDADDQKWYTINP